MKVGDLYLFKNQNEIAILLAKKPMEEYSWAYQFFFIKRAEKLWLREVELYYTKRITKEATCH